jgi:uncharacterized protein (TIGR02996 family)
LSAGGYAEGNNIPREVAMNDRDALMRAICENPDEDTPRLVFADWLQENGEEERAKFIRFQCEAARLPADNEHRAGLVRWAEDIRQRFGDKWLAELPVPNSEQIDWIKTTAGWLGWFDGEAFDRGFPARLFVQTAGSLAKHANVLFYATPVRRLLIWNIKRADKLAKIPQLRHLHTIRIRVVSKQAADDFLECPYLDSVPDIRLSFTALTESHIERLRKKFGDRLRHQP